MTQFRSCLIYLLAIVMIGVVDFGALEASAVNTASVTDQEVGQAIDRIKSYLYEIQDPGTGTWEFRSRPGGVKRDRVQVGAETALVMLALLSSGESFQNPKLKRAITFLQELDPIGTYAVSVRSHVWAGLPDAYLPMLEKDAGWLLEATMKHRNVLFDYESRPSDYVDNSVTQYGILGLWQASRRGIETPKRFWEAWLKHFIQAQQPDGSWLYSRSADDKIGGVGSGNIFDGPGTGSMTTTGLTTLLVIQQELFRHRRTPHPGISTALRDGMKWLDTNFSLDAGGGGYNHYYLYTVERVAQANGVRFLNGVDWFRVGARQIVHDPELNSGFRRYDPIKMAFSLMFLARARTPVWVNKLQIPGHPWNNHPNDMYFTSVFLSDQQEAEVNYQVVSIDDDPDQWLTAPMLFLSSNQPLKLTTQQRHNLKRYLDQGGLLVTSADDASVSFNTSVRRLAAELYPQYEVSPITADHPLLHSWYDLSGQRDLGVSTVSNGGRELIVMVEKDWGYALQSEKKLGDTPAGRLVANLYAYTSNRGTLSNRLIPVRPPAAGLKATQRITVGRPRYAGNWVPEPAAWDPMSDFLVNQSGLGVTTTPIEGDQALALNDIGESDLKLIHLAGTESVTLRDDQLQAIERYTKRGGTLLVETVGGHGSFSRSVEAQLRERMGLNPVPLSNLDPVISGDGVPNAFDNRRALFRRRVTITTGLEPKPRLEAILDENARPMVIFSHYDLSEGLLGCRHWNIFGYQPDTSRRLVTNILLWAHRQRLDKSTP